MSRVCIALSLSLTASLLAVTGSVGGPAEATFRGSDGHIVYDGSSISDGLRSTGLSGDGHPIAHTSGADHPKISPDGKMIVYTGGRNDEVYTVRSDGSHKRHLLRRPTSPTTPPGTPTASTSSSASSSTAAQELYRMKANGTHKKRADEGPGTYNAEPDVAKNGRIAWKGDGGIWVMSAKGKHKKLILAGGFGGPSWAPNAKKLAYTAATTSGSRTDGSHPVDVTSSLGGTEDHPSFSPSGDTDRVHEHDTGELPALRHQGQRLGHPDADHPERGVLARLAAPLAEASGARPRALGVGGDKPAAVVVDLESAGALDAVRPGGPSACWRPSPSRPTAPRGLRAPACPGGRRRWPRLRAAGRPRGGHGEDGDPVAAASTAHLNRLMLIPFGRPASSRAVVYCSQPSPREAGGRGQREGPAQGRAFPKSPPRGGTRLSWRAYALRRDYIIPPMSGIPPPGMPPPSFSGGSATMASVVRMFLAIDAAF